MSLIQVMALWFLHQQEMWTLFLEQVQCKLLMPCVKISALSSFGIGRKDLSLWPWYYCNCSTKEIWKTYELEASLGWTYFWSWRKDVTHMMQSLYFSKTNEKNYLCLSLMGYRVTKACRLSPSNQCISRVENQWVLF